MPRVPHNSQTILREYVEQQRVERAPEQGFNDYFAFVVPQILLRDRSLSEDEIEGGLIGGGGDGGVDSMYIFVDDVLVAEDTDLSIAKVGAKVEVEIFQAKTEKSFNEETLNKWRAVSECLFSLNAQYKDLADVYGEGVRSSFDLFRMTYRSLLRKAPTLSITYTYTTFRPPNEISAGLNARCDSLRRATQERFPDATVRVLLLGAADLWERIIRQPRQMRTLVTQRSSSGRDGYICLVSLPNINMFLREDDGKVSQSIFDENVRDWQGLTSVNLKISEELKDGGERDFWWLNNGITIICTEYRNDDNLLTITNPQIVNGLQTCKEISQYFDRGETTKPNEQRSVLVKVIRVNDDETRDRVIRATNSQNPVSVAMLRATDSFQRSIEQYMLARELYYERRKNYYSNRGRPSTKIVSLTFLAQSVLALFNFRPDDARARPSNPLKNDNEYKELFDANSPLNAFYVAAYVCRFVELYLRKQLLLSAKEVNNLRFYVAMVSCWMIVEKPDLDANVLAQIDVDEVTTDIVETAYAFVLTTYRRIGADDNASRGSLMKTRLRNRMRKDLAAAG